MATHKDYTIEENLNVPMRDRDQANAILRQNGYKGVEVDKAGTSWYFVGEWAENGLAMTDLESASLNVYSVGHLTGRDMLDMLGSRITEHLRWSTK